jgi:DNA-binding response OmpR family regulator
MELATTQKFDLIILDVDLDVPHLTGFDICQELKQRHISYQTPIFFISGNGTEERQAKAFELGAADFIAKPFEAADFINRIISRARIGTRKRPDSQIECTRLQI